MTDKRMAASFVSSLFLAVLLVPRLVRKGLRVSAIGATRALLVTFYDHSLDPPAKMTANGVAAGPCSSGKAPIGTTTEYDEGIDIDQTHLNGGAPNGDGGINSIDPRRLIRDPNRDCATVYPWNFVRTNTIFRVVHEGGGYTAWSDKHPSYSSVSGPGNGPNVDDYYSPEINSIVVNLPG
jgi:hypothetical protein